MSDKRPAPAAGPHALVVPHAGPPDERYRAALAGLRLPALEALLARLVADAPDTADEDSLSPPHERALARTRGLPVVDGLIPTAAAHALSLGLPGHARGWAWLVPCHWEIGMNEVVQTDPAALQLTDGEAQALHAAMQPYLQEDGLVVHARVHPTAWLVQSPLLAGLPTASLDRVIGHNIHTWNLGGDAARPLRRLQQEMQMLLYNHPVNDAREARRAWAVNSFWLCGTGDLPAGWQPPAHDVAATADALLQAVRRDDPQAWRTAWQQLDSHLGATLLPAARAGQPVSLTLCGARSARRWHNAAAPGLGDRLRGLFRPLRAATLLESVA